MVIVSASQSLSQKSDKTSLNPLDPKAMPLSFLPFRQLTLNEARELISRVYKAFKTKKIGETVVIAGYITREDFLELLEEDVKLERIGGLLLIHSPASFTHESQFSFLMIILDLFARAKGLGLAMGSRLAFDVPSQDPQDPDTVEPDLSLITPQDAEEFRNLKGPLPRLPKFLIEILSPGTRDYDLTTKRKVYFNAGVQECWFIDHEEEQVYLCRRTVRGFRCRVIDEGIIHSKVVTGFWLDVKWLWQDQNLQLIQTALGKLLNDPRDWETLLSHLDSKKLAAVLGVSIVPMMLQQFGAEILPVVLEHFGAGILPVVLEHFGAEILPVVLEHFGAEILPVVLEHFGVSIVLPEIFKQFGTDVVKEYLDKHEHQEGNKPD